MKGMLPTVAEAPGPAGGIRRPLSAVAQQAITNARVEFLETGEISPWVRPQIAASWRRSVLSGFDLARASLEPATERFDGRLLRAARPAIEARAASLAEIGCALVLTDAEARVLHQQVGNLALEGQLLGARVALGSSLDEEQIGTNAAAIAIETGETAEVYGAEHLVPGATGLGAAGVPIGDPGSGRTLGTLSAFFRLEDASPVLILWLTEIAKQIEQRVLTCSDANERCLLDAYLSSTRTPRHPVICLDQQTILSNAAAARLLSPVDQARLWEEASRAIDDDAPGTTSLLLANGQEIQADWRPIRDGGTPVGVKIEISCNRARRRSSAATKARVDEQLPPLVGGSPRWRSLCGEAISARALREPVLLTGEAGTGKLAIATAMYSGEQVDVLDATLHCLGTPGGWVEKLHRRLEDPVGVVVLQHLEALDSLASRTVSSLLAKIESEGGPAIVGTVTMRDGTSSSAGPIDGFGSVVEVPAMRDRIEDLQPVLNALTERIVPKGSSLRWMPDAIQTLARVELPANVRSLEQVVKQVAASASIGYVDARDLPPWIRAASSRRKLSRLERLEAGAISAALAQSGGNKLKAANQLGIARSTLYRRLNVLGINLSGVNF